MPRWVKGSCKYWSEEDLNPVCTPEEHAQDALSEEQAAVKSEM